MDTSSNDDEEPQICTVFSSAPSNSKSVFDTIAFSSPRKETNPDPIASSVLFSSLPVKTSPSTLDEPVATLSKTASMISINADDLQSGDSSLIPIPQTQVKDQLETSTTQRLFFSEEPDSVSQTNQLQEATSFTEPATATWTLNLEGLQQPQLEAHPETVESEHSVDIPNLASGEFDTSHLSALNYQSEGSGESYLPHSQYYQTQSESHASSSFEKMVDRLDDLQIEEEEQPLPTAKSLFEDAPEVPFPVNIGFPDKPQPGTASTSAVGTVVDMEPIFSPSVPTPAVPFDVQHANFRNQIPTPQENLINYTADASYDAWIISAETRQALQSLQAGAYFPETSNLTTPGIIYDEDFVDKVALNIGWIFGEAEASKRKILTADNVNQDENGLRELIKLGCYRSALNLTKRLLTLYGQGAGKAGQYSKHSPQSLQIWFTRITLLVRIREFATAAAEVEAFKDFDNVDMYYEFYGDTYGAGRKGTMVPFYFRVLAAETSQYMRKSNDTVDKLTTILITTQLVLTNLENGFCEDGSSPKADTGNSLEIWKKREIRVLYSLVNASLFVKDFYNAFNALTKLCKMDPDRQPQLKSAIGRLFLQHGDLLSAQKYFQDSSELRSLESEPDQVDTLLDSALTAIAQSSYGEALTLYKQALILQPENFTILNNMAVCLLYLGKVKESLALMEATVRQNAPQSLQENVLLNLSSIYELENTDGHKKHLLLKLIGEYKGDGVNLASLKLQNLG